MVFLSHGTHGTNVSWNYGYNKRTSMFWLNCVYEANNFEAHAYFILRYFCLLLFLFLLFLFCWRIHSGDSSSGLAVFFAYRIALSFIIGLWLLALRSLTVIWQWSGCLRFIVGNSCQRVINYKLQIVVTRRRHCEFMDFTN